MDNVTAIFEGYDTVHAAFCDMTHHLEAVKELYGLDEHQASAVASYLARYTQDYGYYSINDLMEDDEEDF